jgi:ribosomal protein S8
MNKLITKINNISYYTNNNNKEIKIEVNKDNYSLIRIMEQLGYIRDVKLNKNNLFLSSTSNNNSKINDNYLLNNKYSLSSTSELIIKDKTLKLDQKQISFIIDIKDRFKLKLKLKSTPGRRIFISNKEVISVSNIRRKRILNLKQSKVAINYLFTKSQPVKGAEYIIRTSKGLMTLKNAYNNNLGGELLLRISYK